MRACLDLIAPNKPAVPALHRWGKQLPAYTWWLAGILVHRLIPRSFGMLQSTLDQVGVDPDMPAQAVLVARAFLGEDADGGGGEQGISDVKEELRQRRKAADRFLNEPDASSVLAVSVLILLPLQGLTASGFAEARTSTSRRLSADKEGCHNISLAATSVVFVQTLKEAWRTDAHYPTLATLTSSTDQLLVGAICVCCSCAALPRWPPPPRPARWCEELARLAKSLRVLRQPIGVTWAST